MLTKTDFSQIRKIVKEEAGDSEHRIRKDIKRLESKVDKMDNFLDKEVMKDRKRIGVIEKQLGISQSSIT